MISSSSYDGTTDPQKTSEHAPIWKISLPEISVKIVNVMQCLHLLFSRFKDFSEGEIKIAELE